MNLWWALFSTLLSVGVTQLTDDPEKLRNWCLDAKYHKTEPGPEDELHKQCTPWKNRACCTNATTASIHTGQMYNFDYNHCGKKMSDKCLKHFTQDHCFFECSPNLGPWVVKIDMKTRNETIYGVPLCANDCEEWFDDCKGDLTCTPNWLKGFSWAKGKNTCRDPGQCKTIKEMYKTAANFCEEVWDHDWKYTDSQKPCMHLWFNGTAGNPNDQVAEQRIAELVGSAPSLVTAGTLVIAAIFLTLIVSQ